MSAAYLPRTLRCLVATHLGGSHLVEGLQALPNLPQLECLRLPGCSLPYGWGTVGFLPHLASLTQLTELSLRECIHPVGDSAPLKSLPHLATLSLAACFLRWQPLQDLLQGWPALQARGGLAEAGAETIGAALPHDSVLSMGAKISPAT